MQDELINTGIDTMSPPAEHNSSTTLYRVEALEREMPNKVSIPEYRIEMQTVRESSNRVEDSLNRLMAQIVILQDKVANQATETATALSKLEANQQKSLSDFQLKCFYGLLSVIGIVVGGYFIWYFTNPH